MRKFNEKAISEFGTIDILINNAAVQQEIPSHETTLDDYNWVVGINLTGSFLCAREIIKHFLDKNIKGNIINISSPHEIIPKPGYFSISFQILQATERVTNAGRPGLSSGLFRQWDLRRS